MTPSEMTNEELITAVCEAHPMYADLGDNEPMHELFTRLRAMSGMIERPTFNVTSYPEGHHVCLGENAVFATKWIGVAEDLCNALNYEFKTPRRGRGRAMNGNDAIVILFGMSLLVYITMFIQDMTKLYKSAHDQSEYQRGYKDGVNAKEWVHVYGEIKGRKDAV